MDWQKDVIRRVMEGAGEHPAVQLHFLLKRLEQHPDAASAIADAMQDMANWYQSQAAGLHAVLTVRKMAGNPPAEK
ncbi:MAG: hypothetical protein COW54_05945 [Rhodobacteraceae bacterium CG17_big_fil_post_rev_8_21_14_2_50_63_15]|nr:hypothetical protein [Roseovarius sp.]PIV79078.1 MAG: hypothetical protein COW54_05945 [Rhodobacteraceae bacterium CG17_big_fil_post_rev_8_21_14_2_50_63_15]